MSQFINNTACRAFLLDRAQAKWPGKFTRVGNEVFEFLDNAVRQSMESFIRSHPTVGKTLKTGTKKEKEDKS